ncbi:hypothetical protein NHH73_22650 [Oxalobacteraceae bacterium OTU3CINTB1]|nr:hypothetical protein NHH73_22650 [Oxalobacteraceae bacterium OTU3CINTB1]
MYQRKDWLEKFRRDEIVTPLREDPRTKNNEIFGHSPDWNFRIGIGGGQADFDEEVDNLKPRDRAMLYAYFNQKAHVDELIHAFNQLVSGPADMAGITVLDIGCGPFTAGLALANIVGPQESFIYHGIDRCKSMRDVGSMFATKVREVNETHPETWISFHESLNDVQFAKQPPNKIIVVILSYLFASATIDVNALADEIIEACKKIGWGPVFVFYTNTTREAAGANFPAFRDKMISEGFTIEADCVENFIDTDKPRKIHYALFVRPVISKISSSQFQI